MAVQCALAVCYGWKVAESMQGVVEVVVVGQRAPALYCCWIIAESVFGCGSICASAVKAVEDADASL